MKRNYNDEMKKIVESFNGERKTLLLHSCCGPCSSAVIERLKDYFDITILYYNPNILPEEEYEKRKTEQIRLIEILNENSINQEDYADLNYNNKIKILDCDYQPSEFACAIKGKENLSEGSERCKECYRLRLTKTAKLATENDFDYFGTTLSVSPHKNVEWLNEILEELGQKTTGQSKPLLADFKKENGYLRSIKLANEYKLYRQNYCGCRPNLN